MDFPQFLQVPNLYNMEDKSQILDMCQKGALADGKQGPAAVFNWYVEQCRKFLHIVLCLSPIGETGAEMIAKTWDSSSGGGTH